jgi:acetylornithine deacetylase/succinyl-diaminopimelate desuccinylase-like protein
MFDIQFLQQATELEEAAALTAQLVGIRSYPGGEGDVQRAIAAWLRANGVDAELHELGGDRPNVIARIENGPGPTLMFNGHVDTVLAADGWSCDPWQGKREGNLFYGLGAADMKSGVAATMLATRALARRRDLWRGTVLFTAVVDEEAYSIGARALVDAGFKADCCIVAEASFDRPLLGQCGKVLVRCDVTGKASHGSEPEKGINAAVEGAKLVARLDEIELGKGWHLRPTQSVLGFHSGSAQYVITVPEHARFTINRHIIPGETGASVLAQMEALAESLHSPARFTFAIDPPYYPPWEIARDHPVTQRFARAYEAETGKPPEFGYRPCVSDGNYFSADLGMPIVYLGPRGANYHMANEWVDLESIVATVRIYLRVALETLT